MDGKNWRMQLVNRYKNAFSAGDLREIEKILSPNFHELVEDGEISRIAHMDRLQMMIDVSRSRKVSFSDFADEAGDVITSCALDWQVKNETWLISAKMRFRFDDGLIDHIAVWDVTEENFTTNVCKQG